MRLFEKTWQLQIYPFKFFKADGLFSWIALTVGQFSKFEQLAQLVTPFFIAHWRIPQILSQNTVLSPSTRQPWQLMCSGRIGALFNSAHSFAVFFAIFDRHWLLQYMRRIFHNLVHNMQSFFSSSLCTSTTSNLLLSI